MTAPTDPNTVSTPPTSEPATSSAPAPATPLAAAPPAAQGAPPAAKPQSNGCLKAFVIGTVVCVVLGTVAMVGLLMLGKKAAEDIDRTFGVAAVQDYALTIDSCEIDDFDNPRAVGTIVNNSDRRQAFEIKIEFVDEANVLVSNGLTFSGALDKGQTGNWTVPTFDDAGDKPITCRVSEVSYTPFSG